MSAYKPEHLVKWERPRYYAGAYWPDHYVFLTQNRDSDCLERSNFAVAAEALLNIPEPADWPHEDETPVQVVREGHFLCGWVEWIAIHQDAAEHLKAADEMQARLENYPVLNEEHWSEVERQEADEVWANCYDPSERVRYIREHASQFEFQGFADLIQCVRGKFFGGYASELLA